MRIDYVRMPELANKTPAEALQLLYEHCRETADHVMRMSNEIEDLKRKVQELEQRADYR